MASRSHWICNIDVLLVDFRLRLVLSGILRGFLLEMISLNLKVLCKKVDNLRVKSKWLIVTRWNRSSIAHCLTQIFSPWLSWMMPHSLVFRRQLLVTCSCFPSDFLVSFFLLWMIDSPCCKQGRNIWLCELFDRNSLHWFYLVFTINLCFESSLVNRFFWKSSFASLVLPEHFKCLLKVDHIFFVIHNFLQISPHIWNLTQSFKYRKKQE